jgi:hypothetical protein
MELRLAQIAQNVNYVVNAENAWHVKSFPVQAKLTFAQIVGSVLIAVSAMKATFPPASGSMTILFCHFIPVIQKIKLTATLALRLK